MYQMILLNKYLKIMVKQMARIKSTRLNVIIFLTLIGGKL